MNPPKQYLGQSICMIDWVHHYWLYPLRWSMWAAFPVGAGVADLAGVEGATGAVSLAGVEGATGAVSLAGVEDAAGGVSLAGVEEAAGAVSLAGVEEAGGGEDATGAVDLGGLEAAGVGVGLVDPEGAVSLAGVEEAGGVEDAGGAVDATAGVPEETLELVGVEAPACLGASMKNHTTAKIAPKSMSMPSMIRKMASGLFQIQRSENLPASEVGAGYTIVSNFKLNVNQFQLNNQ